MADVRPFRGVRYAATGLGAALCPPYDVISPELAKSLRSRARNAVHLELPEGGGAARYARAASVWRRWNSDGTLVRDSRPAFYVVEERYRLAGRARVRRGFLAALGAAPKAARAIVPHERTLSKPKADRLRMLNALRANVSPIFGVFSDASGSARRALAAAVKTRPVARGKSHAGVSYRLWRVDEPRLVSALRRALAPRSILIADGHHRYEVSRVHHRHTHLPGSDAVLAYFVADEDPGLVVLPTHRIAGRSLLARANELATLKKLPSLRVLEKALARAKNPYAFGLVEKGYHLGVPKSSDGCRSGLAVEWLSQRLLADMLSDEMSYTPDPALAARKAKAVKGSAVLVKPFGVAQVRRAASAVGLLPQKSTYFFPKIATGLVFRPLAP
ncbi:MAG: hypothetical protein A2V88_16735 [Elusimicrobia bacterium RBG_16_66_12]|nr:MAG: hypothetical protein A2V88_16735 [Elusimicrobia bacterium RBG_16_66_12]